MKAPFQIVIPKRGASCSICQISFASGQEIQSQLLEKEEGWLRQDSCSGCFSPIPKAVVWKHTIGLEEKKSPETSGRIEKMVILLQKLIESPSQEEHEEAFLLALYLVRKKVLVHRTKMGLYENLETGEMYLIPKLDFSHFSAQNAEIRLQTKL